MVSILRKHFELRVVLKQMKLKLEGRYQNCDNLMMEIMCMRLTTYRWRSHMVEVPEDTEYSTVLAE